MGKFLIFFVLLLGACTSNSPSPTPSPVVGAGCAIETAISASLSSSVASTLTCDNLPAIQADLLNVLGKANLCTKAANHVKGPIGDILCPMAVSAVLQMIGTKVPATWGCSPTASTTGLLGALTASCSSVVGI